jgi:hydrogenase maturation protease
MTTLAPPSIRLLVCGNADRRDDGAGLAAAAATLPTLPRAVLERIEVRRCGQLNVDDLLDLPAGMAAVVVDAAVGIEPGEVVVLDLAEVAAHADAPAPHSSHELPPSVAISLAGTLRGSMPGGSFVGIGGGSFTFGRSLSRPVRTGLAAFRAALAAELTRLAAA